METKNNPDMNMNSFDIVRFMFKHKVPILIVTLLAAIISIIVSLQITPKYKSSVVIYPKTQVSASNALVSSELINSDDHIMNFGEEEEAEQLIQTLQSEEIRFKIIERFDLLNHYDIDPGSRYPQTELNREYDDNISFTKTDFQAVQITVLDKDPQVAADIANEISALLDSTLNKMQRDVAVEIFNLVDKEYVQLLLDIDSLEKELSSLQNQYRITSPRYVSLSNQLINENDRLSKLKNKRMQAKVDAEQELPRKFTVTKAYPSEKKAFPVRWLIVSVSTISAFLFMVFLLLFFHRYKDLLGIK